MAGAATTKVICWRCEKEGHKANDCPDTNQRNNNRTQRESSFQKWLGQCTKASSLEQQMDLARHLYEKAEGGEIEESGPTTRQLVDNLRMIPLGGIQNLVTWKGIRLGWFLNTFAQISYVKKLQEEGVELWLVRKVCIIELIRRTSIDGSTWSFRGSIGGPFVNFLEENVENPSSVWYNREQGGSESSARIVSVPTTFISYTGEYRLDHLFEALGQLDENEYIWLDILCVDQFAWTGRSRSDEMKVIREIFMQDLRTQIKRINRTALVLAKWNDVMKTLSKVWVLWEVYNTAKTSAGLEIILPVEEVERYIDDCLEVPTEFHSIQQSLSAIDAERATAENDRDREAILNHMRRQEGGLAAVNNLVISSMRQWLLLKAKRRLSSMLSKPKAGESDHVNSTFLNYMARLFRDHGNLVDAEYLCRQSVAFDRMKYGDSHPFTLKSIHDLSGLLRNQRKLDEAEPLAREAMEGSRQGLGDRHPDTLSCINNMALLLEAQGKLEEAERLCREALDGRLVELGSEHRSTLNSLVNMARILCRQKKLSQARPLIQQAWDSRKRLLGDQHPETLVCVHAMANLLRQEGRFEEAIELFHRAVDGRRQQLGDNHPHSQQSVACLAEALRDRQQGNI